MDTDREQLATTEAVTGKVSYSIPAVSSLSALSAKFAVLIPVFRVMFRMLHFPPSGHEVNTATEWNPLPGHGGMKAGRRDRALLKSRAPVSLPQKPQAQIPNLASNEPLKFAFEFAPSPWARQGS